MPKSVKIPSTEVQFVIITEDGRAVSGKVRLKGAIELLPLEVGQAVQRALKKVSKPKPTVAENTV